VANVAKADPKGLYNMSMGTSAQGGIARSGSSPNFTYMVISGRGQWPVVFVSYFDAQRFANWLHNGQPTGAQDATTTEDGAYTMGATDVPPGPARNSGALFFVPTEDEWYKAAYYDAASMSYNPFPFADGFNGAACGAGAGSSSRSPSQRRAGSSSARPSRTTTWVFVSRVPRRRPGSPRCLRLA
jgi:formylglycine-generating enzyme required for sulfatase activity